MESLDEQEMERYHYLRAHPVRINMVPNSRLLSCGLFTAYQAASLEDYRCRFGDILSEMELAAVDGFSEESAKALSPFVAFDSRTRPGSLPDTVPSSSSTFAARGALRKKQGGRPVEEKYGFKCNSLVKDRINLSFGGSRSYEDRKGFPSVLTGNVTYYGTGKLDKLVMGDYNARFGQGLALWSGLSLSSYCEPENFLRRPSGISPVNSFTGTGSLRGIAADFSYGKWILSPFVKIDDGRISPGVNAMFLFHDGQFSLLSLNDGSHFGTLSGNFAFNIGGSDFFSELAYDFPNRRSNGIAGCVIHLNDNCKGAVLARYLEGKMHSVTGSLSFVSKKREHLKGKSGFGSSVARHKGSLSLDAEYLPKKKTGENRVPMQYGLFARHFFQASQTFSLEMRAVEKIRTHQKSGFRTDLRIDAKYSNGNWLANARANSVLGRKEGLLSYVEGGHKGKAMSVYVRGCLYRIDDWDDRIYVYERDAPGTFNVPAYYGRGFSISVFAGFKAVLGKVRSSFYLRSSLKNKPGAAELKIQCVFDL